MVTENVFIPSYTAGRDIIIKMTKAGVGILYVGDSFELIGIITDGDLRRGIDEFGGNFFDINASQICNKRPLILDHKCTINEAIKLLVQRKVVAAPVQENNEIIGTVRLIDLEKI